MFGLILTFIISTIISTLISLFTGFSWQYFITFFLFTLFIQFITWNIIIYCIKIYKNYLSKKLKLEEIKTLSKFTFKISCASCHQDFNIELGLNDNNIFECPHCKSLNKVYLTIKNVLVLTNIQDVNAEAAKIYDKLQEKLKNKQ